MKSLKVQDVFNQALERLRSFGFQNIRLEVQLLFEHLKSWSAQDIIVNDQAFLSQFEVDQLDSWLNRRCEGEPMAYILGHKYFYKNKFAVNKNVLIPRPETELIVEDVLSWVESEKLKSLSIVDFGAGSGCIGLSLLSELPLAELTLVEKSDLAMSVAKENAKALKLDDRCEFMTSSVQDLALNQLQNIDIVVANPPYICPKNGFVEKNVKKYEPEMALFSEDNGYLDIRSWVKAAIQILNSKKSLLAMEFGDGQADNVLEIINGFEFFKTVDLRKDYAGLFRYILGEK